MKRVLNLLLVALAALPLFWACSSTDDARYDVSTEIKVDDPIVIRLDAAKPVEDFSKAAQVAAKVISISPKVPFDVDFTDGQTMCIYPRERLQYNTTYKVTANVAKIQGAPGVPFSFEVSTLPPQVTVVYGPLVANQDVEGQYSIEVTFVSSDPLEEKYLETGFDVKYKPGTLIWSHSEDGLRHMARLDNIVALDKSFLLEMSHKYPLYRSEDNRTYVVPSKNEFSVLESSLNADPLWIDVVFSSRLDKSQNFANLVSVPNAGHLKFNVENNLLRIYPEAKMEQKVGIVVSKGIKSASGVKLEEDFERTFAIPGKEPMIKFITRGMILPSSNGNCIHFRSANYAKVRVKVEQIYENNIIQYLQNNDFKEIYPYIGNVSRPILDTTYQLASDRESPKLRSINTYGLDLASLFRIQKGAVYRVTIRGVDPLVKRSDDYYWESEYYFGSYEDYKQRAINVLSSDLGIIAKGSDKGAYRFFVVNLVSASPTSGARVKVFNDVNQLICEGNTGQDGCYECQISNDVPHTVVVSSGSDKSYLRMEAGSALSLSNFDVSGIASRSGQKGYVFGERGVWRPGDDIHITFISMLDEGVLPADHPVRASLINPFGQTMKTIVNNDGHNGMYSFKFSTDSDAPTGNWEVLVSAGGEEYSKTVKIETVKPNNILINLSLNDNPAVPSSNVRGDLSAHWLVGTPAAGLEVRVEADLSKGTTAFPKFKNYVFEDRSRYAERQTVEVWHGSTDAGGNAHFNANLKLDKSVPGFLKAVVTTRVFEKTGDFSIDNYMTTVSPFDTYLGLNVPLEENDWGQQYLDKGKTHTFSLVAVDAKGNASTKPVRAEVEVYRIGWDWWWSSSSDYLASYAKDSYNEPYKVFTTSVSDGVTSFKLDFNGKESGFFFVRVTDLVGGHATSQVFLVSDDDSDLSEGQESAARLAMKIDKDKYTAGETAHLVIPSDKGARALVSIEKGETVLKTYWVDCSDTQTIIPIKLDVGMTPNVYVSVTLVQPHNNTLNDAPIRMFGVQRINVEDASTHLNPVISMPEEVRPESDLKVTVKEQNGRAMSYVVALVDEGLLSLTRFKTPDPWSSFYATEALGVRTWDLYDLVIGAFGARMEQLFAIGGDGENETVTPNSQAERFKPVSMFMGPFDLKAKGTASHTLHIPQYIGNLRAMVIATDGKSMGSSDKNVSVTKPVMVKTTLPRVIGTDEEFAVPVTIFTTKDNVGKISVSLNTSGPLAVTGDSKVEIDGVKAGDQIVFFNVKASSGEGVGKVKATATCKGESSVEDLEIQVRDPNPLTTNSVAKVIEPGKTVTVDFQLAGRVGTNEAKVEASSIPSIDLDHRLNYLVTYPHGCIEQTVSGAFPQLYVSDIAGSDYASKANCEANVKAAIAALPKFALPSGGMTYWPGTSSYEGANIWGSVYALHFMVEAQNNGYAVSSPLRKSLVNYVKGVASDKNVAAMTRCYATYVLALAGSPARSDMNRLLEDLSKYPASCSWYLAAAFAVDKKMDTARKIIASVPQNSVTYNRFSSTFDSEERDMSIAAMVYNLTGDKVNAFKSLQTISGWLNDRRHYMSTQSTAWTLKAVADYVRAYPCDKISVDVRNSNNRITLSGKDPVISSNLNVDGYSSVSLEVTNNSKEPAYVVLSSRGVPEKGEEQAKSSGLQIVTRYTLPEGGEVDPTSLKQGTDFYVTTTVTNTSATVDYTNLALSQIFASGWEIRCDRTNSMYQDIRDDRVYSYFNLPRSSSVTIKLMATAAYRGQFYMPSTICEAMYDDSVNASTVGGWCTVK